MRSMRCARNCGSAATRFSQADGEGFTNEEGYHIVWQFSDSVSGPWKMGVLQDGVWHHFTMDLGDPDHRAAFLEGSVPDDLISTIGTGLVEPASTLFPIGTSSPALCPPSPGAARTDPLELNCQNFYLRRDPKTCLVKH